jgi:hypothetical protein
MQGSIRFVAQYLHDHLPSEELAGESGDEQEEGTEEV